MGEYEDKYDHARGGHNKQGTSGSVSRTACGTLEPLALQRAQCIAPTTETQAPRKKCASARKQQQSQLHLCAPCSEKPKGTVDSPLCCVSALRRGAARRLACSPQ